MTRDERLAAIRRALEHPRYYDGNIGADIRWLLGEVSALQTELDGANQIKFLHERDAAEGWRAYRELRAVACEPTETDWKGTLDNWMAIRRVNELARLENERATGNDYGRRAMVELCDKAINDLQAALSRPRP